MDPLLLAALGGVGLLLALYEASRPRPRAWTALVELARSFGLRHGPMRRASGSVLAWSTAGWTVHVEQIENADADDLRNVTLVSIQPFEGAEESRFPNLSIEPRGLATLVAGVLGGGETATGDARFDAAFRVRGTLETIHLALVEDVRARLLRLHEGGSLRLRAGELRVERIPLVESAMTLRALVDSSLDAMESISVHGRADAAQLVRRLREETSPSTRLRLLRLLVQRFPGDSTLDAARGALADPDVEVRVLAAWMLGAEGHPVLRECILGAELPEGERAALLREIAPSTQDADLATFLRNLLASSPGEGVRLLVLEVAGARKLWDVLFEALSLGERIEPRAAVVLAEALGTSGDARAEPALLRMLREGPVNVRVAAARSLVRAGTVESVEALLPLAEGMIVDGELRRAARAALFAIRARLGSPDAGRLSVADAADPHGGLSPAEDRDGRLSDAAPETGESPGSPAR